MEEMDMRSLKTTVLVCALLIGQVLAMMFTASVLPVVAGPEPPKRSDPVLSNGGVTPTSGDPRNDTFVFYVNYYDADGDWPGNVSVIIDDISYFLYNYTWTGKGGNFSYSSHDFESGTHEFHFLCMDYYYNKTILYPSSGTLSFTIDPGYHRPQLFNLSVSNDEPSVGEKVDFSVWYKDQDGDPFSEAVLVVDHVDRVSLTGTGTDLKNGIQLKCNWTINYRRSFIYYIYATDQTRLIGRTQFAYLNVPDHPPELFAPGLDPEIGDARNDSFTFSIWSKDIDGDYRRPYLAIEGELQPGYNETYFNSYRMYGDYDDQDEIKTGINFSRSIQLYSGLHKYYFFVSYWEYRNGTDTFVEIRYPKTGFLNMTAGGNYNPPVLYNASVTPLTGNTSTEFTFRVWYRDPNGDRPLYVWVENVEVNGTMSIKGSTFKEGVLCELKTRVLRPGKDYVYFSAADITGLPAYNEFNGTMITVLGSPGLTYLSNGTVEPKVTEVHRDVRFYLEYNDQTGGIPSESYVVVNDERYNIWYNYRFDAQRVSLYNYWGDWWQGNSSSVSGTYKYHFEVVDSQYYPLRYPETGELSFDVFDHIPDLYNPSVSPSEGNDLTIYEFKVNFSDWKGLDPTSVQLFVDGEAYNMEIGPKMSYYNFSNESYRVCKKTLTLTPGEHSYYFKATITGGAYNICPQNGVLKLKVDGHSELYGPAFAPSKVFTDDIVNFTIKFKDTAGMPPDYIQIFIDNDVHDMIPTTGAYPLGVEYHFATGLSKGNHTYYFVAENDHGILRDPGKGKYHTLTVLEPHAPTLSDGLVSPGTGNISTDFTFSCTYIHLDGDQADSVALNIDGTGHAMTPNGTDPTTGVRFTCTKRLTKGTHAYYFEAKDPSGRTARLPVKDAFTITVSEGGGGPSTEKQTPKASISISRSGMNVTFSGKGSTDLDGNITFYSWVIDGKQHTGAQVTLGFDKAGYYKATLTVVDDDGLSDTTSIGFWVFSEGYEPSSDINEVGASAYVDGSGNGKVLMNETGFTLTMGSSTDGSVSFEVKSESSDPKVVIMEVSKDVLKVSDDGRIIIKVDGIEVEMANSLEDVLTANGSKPLFYLIETGDSYKVVLYLPDPSDVDVEIGISEPEEGHRIDTGTIVLIATLALCLLIALLLVLSYLRSRGMLGDAGPEKGLIRGRDNMIGGPLGKDLASPWKEGLGEDLEGYLDEVLDTERVHFAGHDPSSLKDRLRKRMDRGDLTRTEYRKYVGLLERIEE